MAETTFSRIRKLREAQPFEYVQQRALQSVDAFLNCDIDSAASLPLLARHCEIGAHLDHPSAPHVDWQMWRLSVECALLFTRCTRQSAVEYGLKSWSMVSARLALSYGLALTARKDLARAILESLEAPLVPVVDRIALGLNAEHEISLGAIGLFFEAMLGRRPKHRAFDGETPTLAMATAARAIYSNAANPGGALLEGPEGDLIPRELIYLNTMLPRDQREAHLTAMADAMAQTNYPDVRWFQDLDIRIAVEGY